VDSVHILLKKGRTNVLVAARANKSIAIALDATLVCLALTITHPMASVRTVLLDDSSVKLNVTNASLVIRARSRRAQAA
jgi:hypothetical protein